jgi:hypothetical protein
MGKTARGSRRFLTGSTVADYRSRQTPPLPTYSHQIHARLEFRPDDITRKTRTRENTARRCAKVATTLITAAALPAQFGLSIAT